MILVFFVKQKTAYEMRISDWSSDVCSSDLSARVIVGDYTAETFLVQDGRVVAAAVRDITVRKSGFERFMAVAAEQWPFAYGLVAMMLAVGMGWAAGDRKSTRLNSSH